MTGTGDNVFDIRKLGDEMINAARSALGARGPALQTMAEMELRRLAGTLADIGSLLAKGEIDQERAKKLVTIHQLTVRSVLRSIEGLGLLAADQAIHAVMRAAAVVLNRAVGFKLIS